MSKRNKLYKFAEIQRFPNVFENYEPQNPILHGENGRIVEMIGQWREKYFQNDHPIILELACGRGEYTLGLARLNPQCNYIGVDVKGARIWKGACIALEEELKQVAFLRTRIELIHKFFLPGEVDEIWITFPDPFLGNTKTNRRLTAQPFLERYAKILKPGGLLHLKTDEPVLYEFTLEVLTENDLFECLYTDEDIYAKPLPLEALEIKTYYERIHLRAGKSIKYLQARLKT